MPICHNDVLLMALRGQGVKAYMPRQLPVAHMMRAQSRRSKKAYNWLATWPRIEGQNARCKCQQDHRSVGRTNSQGGWSGNLPLLAESASYPKKLGKALLTSWAQGCVAINAAF